MRRERGNPVGALSSVGHQKPSFWSRLYAAFLPDDSPDSWAPAYGTGMDVFTRIRPWDDQFNEVLRIAYRVADVQDRAVVSSTEALLAGLLLALPGQTEGDDELRGRISDRLVTLLEGAPRRSGRASELNATRELATVLRFIGDMTRVVPDYARPEIAILLIWRRSESVWDLLREEREVWLQRARLLSHGSPEAPILPAAEQLVGRTASSVLYNDPFTDFDFVVEQLAAAGMSRSAGSDVATQAHTEGRGEFFAGNAVEAARLSSALNESAARHFFPLRADIVLNP